MRKALSLGATLSVVFISLFSLQCGSSPSSKNQSTGTTGSNTTSPPTTSTAPASQPIQVIVQNPTNGANVASPVSVSATAQGNISGWAIYADHQNVYQASNNSTSLTASVNLPPGQHTISITASDSTGGHGDSAPVNISVLAPVPTPSPSPTPSPLPTPPANATVFTNLEETTDNWHSCSDCAGGTVTTNYSTQLTSSPMMSGQSRQFYNGGAAWADVLWYRPMGAHNSATNFLWDFYVYFDAPSAANVHSAEYDLYQAIGGVELMIGSQCVFGEGFWDTWDQAAGHWVHTAIPCPRFSSDTWHHIQWYMQRVSPTQYRYDTLIVDGQAYKVDQTFSGSPIDWSDTLGVQWQTDLGANGVAATEWIDQVTLTIW